LSAPAPPPISEGSTGLGVGEVCFSTEVDKRNGCQEGGNCKRNQLRVT
jgi:hypothetical protein